MNNIVADASYKHITICSACLMSEDIIVGPIYYIVFSNQEKVVQLRQIGAYRTIYENLRKRCRCSE